MRFNQLDKTRHGFPGTMLTCVLPPGREPSPPPSRAGPRQCTRRGRGTRGRRRSRQRQALASPCTWQPCRPRSARLGRQASPVVSSVENVELDALGSRAAQASPMKGRPSTISTWTRRAQASPAAITSVTRNVIPRVATQCGRGADDRLFSEGRHAPLHAGGGDVPAAAGGGVSHSGVGRRMPMRKSSLTA